MMSDQLRTARNAYQASPTVLACVALAPVAILPFFVLLFGAPPLKPFGKFFAGEHGAVELATFGCYLAAGIGGLMLARQTRRRGDGALVWGFYGAFGLALIVAAMEEIAWGQWLIGFETPASVKDINVQGELTLHNIEGLHGHAGYLRAGAGLGALVGVLLGLSQRFRKIGAPWVLAPWFALVASVGLVEVYGEFSPVPAWLGHLIDRLAEPAEMMLAASIALYMWLNARALRLGPGARPVSKAAPQTAGW